MVRMVRMVRSLADRTFQLWSFRSRLSFASWGGRARRTARSVVQRQTAYSARPLVRGRSATSRAGGPSSGSPVSRNSSLRCSPSAMAFRSYITSCPESAILFSLCLSDSLPCVALSLGHFPRLIIAAPHGSGRGSTISALFSSCATRMPSLSSASSVCARTRALAASTSRPSSLVRSGSRPTSSSAGLSVFRCANLHRKLVKKRSRART